MARGSRGVMQPYDPETAPDRAEWLALAEEERIGRAMDFHEASGIEPPNARMHAVMHCVVETQLAQEFVPAVQALKRLRREGLSRHDAIHAIASVLAEHLHKLMHGGSTRSAEESNRRYGAELARLNLRRWQQRYGAR